MEARGVNPPTIFPNDRDKFPLNYNTITIGIAASNISHIKFHPVRSPIFPLEMPHSTAAALSLPFSLSFSFWRAKREIRAREFLSSSTIVTRRALNAFLILPVEHVMKRDT